MDQDEPITGFYAPVHRALTEQILLGGAPRAVAIVNGALADFLPWAALVGKGVILNKDGAFQRTARFRGPDLDSVTPAELVAITGRLNNALRRLDSGWAIFIEAQRDAANWYPSSRFPDATSELVDAERRAQFEEEETHFESGYFLTLLWLPPADDAARAEAWLYEGRSQAGADWRAALAGFADRTDWVLALIEGFMPEAEWLDDPETLTYLHSCISAPTRRCRSSALTLSARPMSPRP